MQEERRMEPVRREPGEAAPVSVSPPSRPEVDGLTAGAERRLLVAIARRLPRWVTPNGVTALGALGMAGAGLFYALVPSTPLALIGVNLSLVVNWFGDRLDGTLARARRRRRPRHRFYVDPLVDCVGASILLAGVAASHLVAPALVWTALLVCLLMQIHLALEAHATGAFQTALAGVGGTEQRLAVLALNSMLVVRPELRRALDGRLLDLVLGTGTAMLAVATLVDAIGTARRLGRAERGGPTSS